ncbi:MAG TPA: acyl-CoA dehydrogenase, partial [Vicinamibacteria bacterium]
FAEAVEALAEADASVAWCVAQANGCATIAAYLAPAVAREVFGPAGAVLAWGPPSVGRAVAVAGGYRVSGRWTFASGCRHATWLGPACPVVAPDGTPRRGPDGRPEIRTLLVPAAQATLEDVWQVSGLRGTGSDAFALDGAFVPAERTARQAAAERREAGPLYRFPLWSLYAAGFAAVALGIARATLDAFIALAAAKVPRGARGALRRSAVVQAEVARAEAGHRAARAFLHATLDEAWAAAREGELAARQRALLRLAGTDAIHRAARAADRAYQAAGATAIFEGGAFARRFRDIHAVTQQIQARPAHYEAAGRYFLGLDPDGTAL